MRCARQKELCCRFLWLFVTGSVGGYILEGLWCVLRKGAWERHSATLVGPFCTIYGVALIAIYLLSHRIKGAPIPAQFAAYTCCGAVIEYFGSLLQEKLLGVTTWNYQKHFIQFQGRVSLKMSLLLGAVCCIFAWFVLPTLLEVIQSSSERRSFAALSVALALFLAADISVSEAAILRWRERTLRAEPSTRLEALLDETCPSERMEKLFPNMKFSGITNLQEERGKSIMAKSKLVGANEKIAEAVTDGFKKMSDGVTGGFQSMCDAVVGGYTKIEDGFVDRYLTKDGESVSEAKARLKSEREAREKEKESETR